MSTFSRILKNARSKFSRSRFKVICDEYDCNECSRLSGFYILVDNLVSEVVFLREETVRWRKLLLRHLDPISAQNLGADILSGISLNVYYDNESYIEYMKAFRYEEDPMDSEKHLVTIRNILSGRDREIRDICSILYEDK